MINFNELKKLSNQTSVATVSDVMSPKANQILIEGITSATPNKRLFGQAITVRSLPARPDCISDTQQKFTDKVASGDPLMFAIKESGPGKVIVIDAGGINTAAVGGDTKFAVLDALGTEGLITDGALRDQREFKEEFGFATYSSGFTPLVGTGRVLFPHDVNVDINCGGCLVRPGDYIFGDEDGVIVIPASIIEETLNNAIASEKKGLYVREKSIKDRSTYGDIISIAEQWMPDFLANSGLTEKQTAFFNS
jgi:regulator of RNase E activity RraA